MTPEDLEARLTTLEQTVAELSERQVQIADDVGAARVMAAGADHDVSLVAVELRAHRQLLNALRETQRSHSGRLDSIESRLDTIDVRLDRIDVRLDRINVRLDGIDVRLDGIDVRLDRIDVRLDGIDVRLDRIEDHLIASDERTAAGFATMQAGMNQIVALLTERPA